MYTGVFWGDLREGNHLEDPGVDGMDIQEVGLGGMDWIYLAYDRDRRRTLVNELMSLRVPQNMGNFLTSRGTVSFSERTLFLLVSWLCS